MYGVKHNAKTRHFNTPIPRNLYLLLDPDPSARILAFLGGIFCFICCFGILDAEYFSRDEAVRCGFLFSLLSALPGDRMAQFSSQTGNASERGRVRDRRGARDLL